MITADQSLEKTTNLALSMDYAIRAILADAVTRPRDLRDYPDQMRRLNEHSDCSAQVAGRFQLVKRLIHRFLGPSLARQTGFNRMLIEHLVGIHESLFQLTNAHNEAMGALTVDLRRRIDDLRFEIHHSIRELTKLNGEERRIGLADLSSSVLEGSPRLYLGWPNEKVAGALHVAPRPGKNVDLCASLDQLPARPGAVPEIVADHVLDHHSMEEVKEKLLPHWFHVLREEGRLVAWCRDLDAASAAFHDRRIDASDYARFLFGKEDSPAGSRQSAFTPDLLATLLLANGFVNVSVRSKRADAERRQFSFEMEAFKPAA